MTERGGQPCRVLSSGVTGWTCFTKVSLNASGGMTTEGKGGAHQGHRLIHLSRGGGGGGGVCSQFLHLAFWAGRAHKQGFLILCVSCAQIPSATHRESPQVQGLLPPLATSRQEPTEAGRQAGLRKPHSPWTSPDAALSGCL